jgi:hypothetical protein
VIEIKAGSTSSDMSVLEFIAAMTGSIAWPLAAFGIAFIFRNQIRALLQRIKEVGFGGATASFVPELLDEAEKTAEALPPPESNSTDITDDASDTTPAQPESLTDHDADSAVAYIAHAPTRQDDQFKALLSISPSAAVLDTWNEIDRQLGNIAHRQGIVPLKSYGIEVASQLHRAGIVPSSVIPLLLELRQIRNEAAHGKLVTTADAWRFYSLARRVLNVLEPISDA